MIKSIASSAAAAALMLLAACKGTTGVQQIGPDRFVVSEMRAPVLGGAQAAQPVAIGEAINFCRGLGRVFVPITMGPGGIAGYGPTTYTAEFHCLTPDDPQVARLRANHAPYVDLPPS